MNETEERKPLESEACEVRNQAVEKNQNQIAAEVRNQAADGEPEKLTLTVDAVNPTGTQAAETRSRGNDGENERKKKKEKPKRRFRTKVVKSLLSVIGALLFFYGLAVIAALQSKHWFNYIWIGGGLFLLLLSLFAGPLVRMPGKVKLIIWIIIGVCLVNFGIYESRALKAGHAEPETGAKWVIVLGAKVNGTSPSQAFNYRIKAAEEYLKANPKAVAVVTGGQGPDEGASEGSVAMKKLEAAGIDKSRIILEEKSTSTQENLIFAAELIKAAGGSKDDKTVIITSQFHVYRTARLARALDYTDVSFKGAKSLFILLPHYYVREYAAYVKESVTGHFE